LLIKGTAFAGQESKCTIFCSMEKRRTAVPQTLNTIMTGLTVAVAIIMTLRYIANWYRFQMHLDEGDQGTLRMLISEQNLWIVRHGVCVACSLMMVAAIRFLVDFEDYECLARSITTYGIMSFTFAFVESVMAQWLENRMTATQVTQHQVLDYD
jgi:hypothetical protein